MGIGRQESGSLPDQFTPYHEGGHALAATLLEIPVLSGSISNPMIRTPDPSRARGELRKRIVLALAGPIAEDIARGKEDPTARTRKMCDLALRTWPASPDNLIWGEDFGGAVTTAMRLAWFRRDEGRVLIEESTAEACEKIKTGWPAVEALAAAFLETPDIEGDRVVAIIKGALEGRPDGRA